MSEMWPEHLPVANIRVARPTDKLAEVVRFYTEGIGLERVGAFDRHEGYEGVMLGLPGVRYHLEFTHHEDGSPCPAPTKDNLLVFYIPDDDAVDAIVDRLQAMGYDPVEPENPYWGRGGITFEDPDGWRVVFMRRSYG